MHINICYPSVSCQVGHAVSMSYYATLVSPYQCTNQRSSHILGYLSGRLQNSHSQQNKGGRRRRGNRETTPIHHQTRNNDENDNNAKSTVDCPPCSRHKSGWCNVNLVMMHRSITNTGHRAAKLSSSMGLAKWVCRSVRQQPRHTRVRRIILPLQRFISARTANVVSNC